jgi:hypothetical protein
MEKNWFVNNKFVHRIILTGVFITPFLLYFIPSKWIMSGHAICIFKNITGHECYGCGMTRAIYAMIHLHINEAWQYNKLVFIVFPLLIYIWIKTIIELLKFQSGKSNS